MKKAVVVFSGGQDSTICLIQALSQYDAVYCITFNYNQRHKKEITIAQKLAIQLGVQEHKIIDISFLSTLVVSSLICDNTIISSHKDTSSNFPNTFVPGRNILFLTLSAIYAIQVKAKIIITGVCETDFSGYPDCRDKFIKALNTAINLGIGENLYFLTPLMQLKKAEIWALADYYHKLYLVQHNTLTCYNGITGDGCKQCAACCLRARGLEEYRSQPKKVMALLKSKTGLL